MNAELPVAMRALTGMPPSGSGRFRRRLAALAACALLAGCDTTPGPESTYEVATRGLYAATLSASAQLGYIGSIHHGGSLWNLEKNERLYNWNHRENEFSNIVAAAFSNNEKYLASADPQTIALWETGTGANVSFWKAPGDILDIAITDNADFAILGLADHTAVVFDIKRGGILRTFIHNDKVGAVALAERTRTLLTGSDDFKARAWKISSGELLHTFEHENQVNVVAVSPDGRYGFTASQADRAVIWDLKSGKAVSELPIKKKPYTAGASYTAARFSSDGTQLLTGATNRLVQLWDTASGKELKRWRGTKKERWKPTNPAVMAVAFGKTKGQALALASNGLLYRFR